MTTKSKCKTFADIIRMLIRSQQRSGVRLKVSSRPMPSKEFLAREKAEIKAFIKRREERRLYVKSQLLFYKQKDDERKAKREELKNKGNK